MAEMDPKGEKYTAENQHHIIWARQLLDSMACGNQWQHLVDVGCGTGEVTTILAERLPALNIHAVDKFPSMIEEAKKTRSHPRIDYRVLDIEHPLETTDLTNQDAVTSIHVFHWIVDLRSSLTNIRNMLKPGGYFYIVHVVDVTLYLNDIKTVLQPKYPELSDEWYDNLCFKKNYDVRAEYEMICRDLNLKTEMEVRQMNHFIEQGRLNADLISVIYPLVETVDKRIRERVIRDILQLLNDKCRDGKLLWSINDLIVSGTKTE